MNCCSWLAIRISPDFIVSQFIVFSFSCSWGGIIYVEEYNPRFGPIHRGPNEGCEWRHCNTWWTLNVPQNWSQVLWDTKRPPSEQSMNKSGDWLKISGKRKHFTALITLSSGSSIVCTESKAFLHAAKVGPLANQRGLYTVTRHSSLVQMLVSKIDELQQKKSRQPGIYGDTNIPVPWQRCH